MASTIDEIRGEYTDLIERLHDEGAINEGKRLELLNLGMKLAHPNLTAAGRRSGPELVQENAQLTAVNASIMQANTRLVLLALLARVHS